MVISRQTERPGESQDEIRNWHRDISTCPSAGRPSSPSQSRLFRASLISAAARRSGIGSRCRPPKSVCRLSPSCWSPARSGRLTSTFVLWVLYVCYLLLRTLIDEPERRAVVSAVFNIFAAFDIPLVYFSIWFFRTQHPQPVIGAGGSLDPRMLDVLLLCWGATLALLALLLRQRYRVEALRWEVERLRLEAESRVAEPHRFPALNRPIDPKGRPA